MEISILLLKQIAGLFLMIGMGVLMVRTKRVKPEHSEGMSAIALYLITPCVIINSFQIEYTERVRNGWLLALGTAVLIHIMFLLAGEVFGKIFHMNAVEKLSVMYPNAGNLIIPLVMSILGPEWVIYTSAFMCVQLVLLWSHGIMMVRGERKPALRSLLTNVNMAAVVVGIVLFVFQIQLPEIITDTMSSVSIMIGPFCMIITGILIGNTDIGRLYSYKRVILPTVLRMIVIPAIILIILKYSGISSLHPDGRMILLICYLASMAPSAATITQMALVYHRDAEYAGIINVVTTMVCIITMPLMTSLY